MTAQDSTAGTPSLDRTLLYVGFGLITAGVTCLVVLFGVLYYQEAVRQYQGTTRLTGLTIGGGVLLFVFVGIVGAVTDERLSKYRPLCPSSWTWAGWGVLLAVALLGGPVLAEQFGVNSLTWSGSSDLTDTPTESTIALSLLAGIGAVYVSGGGDTDDVRTLDDITEGETPAAPGINDPKRHREEAGGNDSSDDPNDDPTHETDEELEYRWIHETNVSMEDVGGMDDVTQQLKRDVVKPLTTDRATAEALDISPPSVLLYGPPGTGKTFLAKALATELGLPFANLSGADITSKWINESPQRINRLFTEAKQLSRREGGAVIFLDELDAVLSSRTRTSHEENRKIVNEFLAHLQDTDDHNIVFIGATNRRSELDEAATRNGRIDREIEVDLPNEAERLDMLRTQLAARDHSLTDPELRRLAARTEECSAADLNSLVDDAARHAAFDRGDDRITPVDFQHALSL